MSVLKCVFIWMACLLRFDPVSCPQLPQVKTVKAGDDVPLECWGSRVAAVRLIGWRKPDLKSDLYVFFFRDEQPNENFQHPSFRGRVELRDPEMKNGDASVILKNVNVNDTGTYECLIKTNEKDAPERNITTLKVVPGPTAGHNEDGGKKDGDNTDGHHELGVGLSAGGALFVVGGVIFVITLIFRARSRPVANNQYQPAAEAAHQQV